MTLPIAAPTERIQDAVSEILQSLGERPGREGLLKTPARVARALPFLTSGQTPSARQVLSGAVFEEDYEGLVLVRDIEFYSPCEHHLLPFHGHAHAAYLPAGRIVGLSKLPRLVEVFARRLQVQERLTRQVAEALEDVLAPRGVAVMVEARHFCVQMRGVEKQDSASATLSFLGALREGAALRAEFQAAVGAPAGVARRVSHGPRSGPRTHDGVR